MVNKTKKSSEAIEGGGQNENAAHKENATMYVERIMYDASVKKPQMSSGTH